VTRITPYLLYANCEDALDFLARAFGLEETMRLTDAEGRVSHAEMVLGEARVFLGNPGEGYCNPSQLGAETALVVMEVDDADAVCERARTAGAEIVEEPHDTEYGARRFAARDREGHRWFIEHPLSGDAAP
jgi:uncharacterized glyoxalase superfamily protein PhnB